MSLRAMIWSFEQHDTTPTQRLLLLALSNYANSDNETWPKVTTLEDDTGFGKSTIYRERMALCDSGHLTKLDQRDRYRINLVVSERESDSQPGTEIPTAGKALHKGTNEEPDGAAPIERDEAQALYDAFLTKVQGQPPRPITPSLRRTAEKALQEYDLPALSGPALDGFKAWRQKKPGDKRFSSVFASHPGGRPLHDHIGFWISQSGDASGLSGFPSEVRVKIVRAVRDVQRGHGSHDEDTVQQATEAMEFLESKGINCERRSDGFPTFPALQAEQS